ncbi:MAG TPA: Ig-like domain-containing protein [Terriglobales bacterium]|nr:Ig-like domain-containing protein [Terriglobales bacterium]
MKRFRMKSYSAVAYAFILATTCFGQVPAAQFSLGARIGCQTAIERVYWQHRTAAQNTSVSFEQAVPAALIQTKAEDVVLKSAALEQLWGVTVAGAQLQAEIDRMVMDSKAPEVLNELFAALNHDPQQIAECLARPQLVDRLISTYYARDERFHGDLKARATAEIGQNASAASLRQTSGTYTEVEWRRGNASSPVAGVFGLEPRTFDNRIKELQRSFGANGALHSGSVSRLREDDTHFYAVAVLAMDSQRVRVGTVQWQKQPFETWWSGARQQLPMQLTADAFNFTLPDVPNTNCRDDSWKPTMQLLDPRYWHSAVWTGTEMIVFGGMNSVGTEYNDGSRYNPATDTWTRISTQGAPSVRTEHVAVWTGKEMIVFGGTGDKTGGRYNPITDTWKPTSTTNAPLGAFNSTVVWTGKEMIVWGGQIFSTVNTGGRYNPATNTWALTNVGNAPIARAFHTAVWTGTEMIVWGGYDGGIGQLYGDGSRYNPVTNVWTRLPSTNAPTARYFHSAVWTGTEMIVWGGLDYPNYDQSGARYNPTTNTWTPTSMTGAPSFRWMHAAVWSGSEMIVEGGTPAVATGGRYNPATDTWTATNPANSPTNGQGITAIWTGKEMILWGGLDDNFEFHYDGARYNPKADRWLPTSTMNVPRARGLHSAVWTGAEMIVWGGFGDIFLNAGGRYDPATDTWKKTSTAGAPPGRENAESVWTGTEAIFWGGDPDGLTQGTGGRYDPVADTWKLTSRTNAPNQRYGHTAVWTGSEMVVFGGVGTDSIAKRYNPATDIWTNATTTNAPGARDHHGAVWTGTEMIIWGGFINNGSTPTGGRYNPATNTWAQTNVPSSPKTRSWPVSVWTGTEAIFWSGYDYTFGTYFNDGGRYNPVTDSWTKTTLQGAPSPRITQGVWSGSEMVTWGGDFDSSGGRYNPASDSWKPTTKVNAPFVRGGGRWSTVWTGSQMIIWGGVIETQQGNLYCASGQPNTAPVANSDSYTVPAGKQLTVSNKTGVLVNDSDGNGDLLTATLALSSAHGTLQFNANGSFTYKPNAGFSGADSFTYQANDGLSNSNTATVTITVQ